MAMERENRAPRGNGRKRRKVCQFCVDKCEHIDSKERQKCFSIYSGRARGAGADGVRRSGRGA